MAEARVLRTAGCFEPRHDGGAVRNRMNLEWLKTQHPNSSYGVCKITTKIFFDILCSWDIIFAGFSQCSQIASQSTRSLLDELIDIFPSRIGAELLELCHISHSQLTMTPCVIFGVVSRGCRSPSEIEEIVEGNFVSVLAKSFGPNWARDHFYKTYNTQLIFGQVVKVRKHKLLSVNSPTRMMLRL